MSRGSRRVGRSWRRPLARSEVRLPNGPLRTVGEHVVVLHLHTDVNVELPITITAEEPA